MEESSHNLRKTLATDPLNRHLNLNWKTDGSDDEVWEKLSSGFERVQSVLDQNRNLIQRVNENHQSMIPDNLVKNVSLLREINGNISKVVSIYSGLSLDFTNLVRQRKELSKNCNGDGVKRHEVLDVSMEC